MSQETNKPPFRTGQIWKFSAPFFFTPLNQRDRLKPNHYYVVEEVNNDGEAKFLGVQGYFKNYFFDFYSQPTEEPKKIPTENGSEDPKDSIWHKQTSKELDLMIDSEYKHKFEIAKKLCLELSGNQTSKSVILENTLTEEFEHYKKYAEIAHNMMKSLVEKLQSEIKEKDEKIKNLVSIIDNIKEILE